MLYLIGLGLNENSITKEGLLAIDKCDKIYLEGYTVDFPYEVKELEKIIRKKIKVLKREEFESNFLLNLAKKKDIGVLVYGSPLFATTHTSMLNEAKKMKIKFQIIHNASIFDLISETGLQLYKFGKITSMPAWKKNFAPNSFLDIVIENGKINAHSLILVDIGLNFSDALMQLDKSLTDKKLKIDRLIVCSNLGTKKSAIFYAKIEDLKKDKIKSKINSPYCFIIPGNLHFLEEEFLEDFKYI